MGDVERVERAIARAIELVVGRSGLCCGLGRFVLSTVTERGARACGVVVRGRMRQCCGQAHR